MYELPGQGNRPAKCICLLYPLSDGKQHQAGCPGAPVTPRWVQRTVRLDLPRMATKELTR